MAKLIIAIVVSPLTALYFLLQNPLTKAERNQISFKVTKALIGTVEGTFKSSNFPFVLDTINLSKSEVLAGFKVVSILPSHPTRDVHLRTTGFLNADAFPSINSNSTSFNKDNGQMFMKGKLKLKQVEKENSFPIKYVKIPLIVTFQSTD
jgi:polyisoprenoid-binding protein YceI